jgi:hypothetical protein
MFLETHEMRSVHEIQEVNDAAARCQLACRGTSDLFSVAPPKGNLILTIHREDKPDTFQGITGPIQTDRNLVQGWEDDRFQDAIDAAQSLQEMVGLDAKVSVDGR